MSGCCNNKEEKVNQSPKLARHQQTQRDQVRNSIEGNNRNFEQIKQLRRKLAEVENEKLEIYRKQTAFVQKIENQKQEFIQKNSQQVYKVTQLQNKESRFKKDLERDVQKNDRIIVQFTQKVEVTKEFSELDSDKIINFPIDFQSIREYFGVHSFRSSIHENSEIIIQKLLKIYSFYIITKTFQRKLLFCVSCYISFLQEIIRTGYNESLGDAQLKETRNFMQKNAQDLYRKLQSMLSLAKINFTKQRSRILEDAEVDTSRQEMKLRSKIEEQQQKIQELLYKNQHLVNDNEILNSSTLPNLREQIKKKQIKGVEQVAEMLTQMQNNFVTKSEIGDRFQQLEKMICGATVVYTNEQMVEILKSKDIAIQRLQTQLNKYEKQKSLLSEETEPDHKQLHDVLLTKEKEIQQLSQKLLLKDKVIKALQQKLKQSSIISKPEIPSIRRSRSSAQNEMNEMLKQNMKLSEDILLKDGQIESLNRQVQELAEANRKESNELQYIKSQLIEKEQATSSLTQRLQQAQNSINERLMRTEELQRSNLTFNEELIHLNNEISGLKCKLAEYAQRQSLQNEEKRMQINKSSERQYDQIQRLTSEKTKMLKEKQLLLTTNTSLAHEVEELKKYTQKITNDIEEQRKKFQGLLSEEQFKLSEAEMKANKVELEIIETKEELQKLEKRYKEDNSSERLRVELEVVKKELDKTKIKLEQAQKENKRLNSQLDEQKDLSISLQSRLDKMEETTNIDMTNRRMRTASFVEHRTLFIGDVLQKRKGEKKYLMDKIEALMMREIEKTKLLYEFKRDQKTNFHNFIDGHSNLVLIVETHKALIACYYSGVLQEDAPMVEEALILSLDSRKTYFLNTLQHNPLKDPNDTRIIRGMIYDKYFLIIGNAEVRIRTGEARVFSNFGIMSSYFDARKEKVNSLLHEGSNNEVDIINYQIHQVVFSEEFILERAS